MIKEEKTDFGFKNNRRYVHSSTLLEDIRKFVLLHLEFKKGCGFFKIDAAFHKEILFNGSFIFSDETMALEKEKTTAATFKIYNADYVVSAKFNEDINKKVNKNIQTIYGIEKLSLTGSFEGSCRIFCSNDSSLFENLIEANKRIHLMALKDRGENLNVTNLYMKNCPFSLFEKENRNTLELQIKNIAKRFRNGSVLTLNSLSFPEIDLEPFEISYMVTGI
ncbi:MAG: hypothetical protein WC836_15480 [Desulfobacula sp.]|jgi:hypothetical protein